MTARAAFLHDEPWPSAPPSLAGTPSPSEPAPVLVHDAGPSESSPHQIDYEACLDYVRQVGSAMRAAGERVRIREAGAEELARQSQEQISRAESALRQSEERVREAAFKIHDAEARANRAEARAAEAEAWLNRLFDTMQQELQGAQRATAGEASDPFRLR